MFRSSKNFKVLVVIGLSLFSLSCKELQSSPGTPETDCNFFQNQFSQRISWKNETVKLHIDASVPQEFHEAIYRAADQWEDATGRQMFEFVGGSNGAPGRDNVSSIYLLNEWDPKKPSEQARTKIYWRNDEIQEADILVNAHNFQFSVDAEPAALTVDLESLMVHEFGHVLGLKHINGEPSVMASYLRYGYVRRTPEVTDVSSLSCEYLI